MQALSAPVDTGVSVSTAKARNTEFPADTTSNQELPEQFRPAQHIAAAKARDVLVDLGWKIGCDDELLPPAWARRAR